MEDYRNAFKILKRKHIRKRRVGRSRRRWEANDRMYLRKLDINTRNLVDSVQDRDYWIILVNVMLSLQVP
jgi:hypothetical protein